MKSISLVTAIIVSLVLFMLTGCGGSDSGSGGSGDSLQGVKVIGVLDGPLKDNIQNSTQLDTGGGETRLGPLLIPGSEVEFLDDGQKAYIKSCYDANYPILRPLHSKNAHFFILTI